MKTGKVPFGEEDFPCFVYAEKRTDACERKRAVVTCEYGEAPLRKVGGLC